jgi:hypothetical protein
MLGTPIRSRKRPKRIAISSRIGRQGRRCWFRISPSELLVLRGVCGLCFSNGVPKVHCHHARYVRARVTACVSAAEVTS